jgi:hypothetical protein
MMSSSPCSWRFSNAANALSRQEIARSREAPVSEGGIFSAPLLDLESGQLVVSSGISNLTVRAGAGMAELYQARFEGPLPEVRVKDGVVTIRYPRRLLALGGEQRATTVALNVAIPWWIVIKGGAAEITAGLGGLDLAGLVVKGDSARSAWNSPCPPAWRPYGSVVEHQ